MNNIRLIAIVFVGCLLVVGSGCVIGYQTINNNTNKLSFNAGDPIVDEGSDESVVSAIIGPGVEKVATKQGLVFVKTQSYTDALEIYGKSGYRLQISNCSGTPGSFTLKMGVKFMLDNRDNKTHQIVVGTRSYRLAAYDFAIVSINKAGIFNATCDGGGAASILVQK